MINFKDYKLLSVAEHEKLLSLRNSDEVRLSSNDTSVILLENHLAWCEGLERGRYFAIYENSVLLGGVNINDGFWGVFFVPEINPFIKLGCAYAFLEFCLKDFEKICARVRVENLQTLRFNEFFGFKLVGRNDEFFSLELKKDDFGIKNHKIKEKLKSVKTKGLL